MKVGQLFTLPSPRPIGYIGKLFNSDKTKMIAKYEAVEIEEEEGKVVRGRLIVVYKDKGKYKCKK